MEEKRLNERESLEIISEMIQKTKSEPAMKQDYNAFLLYGYSAAIVSVAAWAVLHFTGRTEWLFIWFVLFLPSLWGFFTNKQRKPEVITYLSSMLGKIWQVIGSMFGLTCLAIVAIGFVIGRIDFSLMLPLSLLYAGIGTSMTGLVIKERLFIWLPLVGLVAAIYMLLSEGYDNVWNLLFGASFLLFMVIPAHICRSKIR